MTCYEKALPLPLPTFSVREKVFSLLVIYKYENKVGINLVDIYIHIHAHTQFYTELIKPTLLLQRLPVLDKLWPMCIKKKSSSWVSMLGLHTHT
jgi:hypothetical protein